VRSSRPRSRDARALRYPHETFPPRRRPTSRYASSWRGEWAHTGSAGRTTRTRRRETSINALECTSGDLIFCLDADHVPLPDALDATVGLLLTTRRSLSVQSPPRLLQPGFGARHYEVEAGMSRACFFEVVCPGQGPAQQASTGALGGDSAVEPRSSRCGGVATETIAEDFHTTIKMHRAGWTTHYPRRDPRPRSRAA